jgi:hypothetical protein
MNLKPLDHSRLKLEEHFRHNFFATVEKGTPREAIFDPGFWRHHTKMAPMDKVFVTDDAATFYFKPLSSGSML